MQKILFIGGSLNQTTMMHQIAKEMDDFECWFSPFYADGSIGKLAEWGWLNRTILGGAAQRSTQHFLQKNELPTDFRGEQNKYDLVLIGTDTVLPKNLKKRKWLLVQEGMTVPENWIYHAVKTLNLPRWMGNTSTTGLSDGYEKFCVASEGWKEIFIKKGVRPEKIVVTGIPNFDNLTRFQYNEFPQKNYVLAATSCLREAWQYENRVAFIKKAVQVAAGKKLIFKLHPNENHERAIAEIRKHAPHAQIFTTGNINNMIANCDTLVTKYSTVIFNALALGKKVVSDLTEKELTRMTPLQNQGQSAAAIANVCREMLGKKKRRKATLVEV